jgi:DNA ligase (NAD+)
MMSVDELVSKIQKARSSYYNGKKDVPNTVPDAQYDNWIEQLRALAPNHPELAKVGATSTSSEWEKYSHKSPMGSLDKCNTAEEFHSWDKSYGGKTKLAAEKLDGLSIALVYESGKLELAATRGNGTQGEIITKNVVRMVGVPQTLPISATIRGEIVLPKTALAEINATLQEEDRYSNTRNAASGIARRFSGEHADKLEVRCYQILTDDLSLKTEEDHLTTLASYGFLTPGYRLFLDGGEIPKYVEEFNANQRQALTYDIDGIVVSNNDLAAQEAFGENRQRPYAKIAYKFAAEEVRSTIRSIIHQVGNSGRITPVAVFDPVEILGAKITKCSVHNYGIVKDMGIGVGATVGITRNNDVIPQVNCVYETQNICEPPSTCPCCGEKTRFDGEYLLCDNDSCPARVRGRILTWINVLGVMEWGKTLVDKLCDTGKVSTIADLYKLDVADLSLIDRMGAKSAKKCIDERDKVKDLSLPVFIAGLPIPTIGTSTVKLLVAAGYDTIDKLCSGSEQEFARIAGIGPVRAGILSAGFKKYRPLMDELLGLGITIKRQTSGGLFGKSVCFTGALSSPRKILEKLAADAGADVKGSVGKALTYLITNDTDSTSGKMLKATQLGIKIITEDEFRGML